MSASTSRGLLLALAFFAASAASPALAQSGVRAGVLNCQGPGTVSQGIGSVTQMTCLFTPQVSRHPEAYIATLNRIGFDIGVTNQSVMGWVVFAPTQQIGPGDLSGTYAGVSGGAVIGIGGAANVLIGGSNNSFTLQPVSFQGATGFNITAAVAGLSLQPYPPPHRYRHHRRHRHH